jgi:hypothetical protein
MNCPNCGAKTSVLSTRKGVFRTRRCFGLEKHKFSTTELTGPELNALRGRAFKFDQIARMLKDEALDK